MSDYVYSECGLVLKLEGRFISGVWDFRDVGEVVVGGGVLASIVEDGLLDFFAVFSKIVMRIQDFQFAFFDVGDWGFLRLLKVRHFCAEAFRGS